MSAVVNVLATIGMLAILIVVIYYIWRYIDKVNKDNAIMKMSPSPYYMQNVGLRCPDYWDFVKTDDNGDYVCQDSMGLMSQYGKDSDAKCVYEDEGSTDKILMTFSSVDGEKDWVDMTDEEKINFLKITPDETKYYSRADWIKKCGPNLGDSISSKAVWSGLDRYV